MKKILTIVTLGLSLNAFAIFDDSWERPIESAKMEIVSSHGELEAITQTMVIINKKDGHLDPTSLTLKYATSDTDIEANPQAVFRTLKIKEYIVDSCGSIYIFAENRYPLKRIRESLHFSDHRNRDLDVEHCAYSVYPDWLATYKVERKIRNRWRESYLNLKALEAPVGVITPQTL
jgi:hypothetical protein